LRRSASLAPAHAAPGTLQELERMRIIEALDEAVGNKKLAAKRLGIHRSTLYAKMRRFGLIDDCSDEQQTESATATPVSNS